MTRWSPGENIVLREVWHGRVWSAWPATVVGDHSDLLIVFIPSGTPVRYAVDERTGDELRLYRDRWAMGERHTNRPLLSFSPAGEHHATLAFWDEDWRFTRWYINLETCIGRAATTYDFVDHCLDVVIPADRSSWSWKDEDELAEAIRRGIFSADDAMAFRGEGRRAAERVVRREPPFDQRWENWRPDPTWSLPTLLAGWEIV